MLVIAIQVNQRHFSCVCREVSELRSGRDYPARSWQSQLEQSQSYDQAIQSWHHGCPSRFSSSTLCSIEEHCYPALPSQNNANAAFITEKRFTECRATALSTESSSCDVATARYNSPVLVSTFKHALSALASTPEHSFWDILVQARSYRHLVSRYSSVTAQNFHQKSQELQVGKNALLKIATDSSSDVSC